jgi:hypothetical protein
MILVFRSPALVWDVQMTSTGKIGNIEAKKPWPYVNHYHFRSWNGSGDIITIKMSGHPPFGAQLMLNGHEYVACKARKKRIDFTKEGNCFTHTLDPAGLARVADTLSEQETIGRLSQLRERWIYSTCLLFALHLEEQRRSEFRHQYSIYQAEYSRNLQFQTGGKMEQVFQSLIDRTRAAWDLTQVRDDFRKQEASLPAETAEGSI